jgi:predicted nucleic acid-binding protein
MSETAVVNASPLIYLARTKFLHLLQLAAPGCNVVSDARPVLEALRAAGMYLSDRIVNTALAELGE